MKIPIVLSSNSNYVPYMSTAIQSIIENHKGNSELDFYIFHNNINDDYQYKLIDQIKPFKGVSLKFVDVSIYFENFSPFTHGISIEAYYRLYIPYFFKDTNKVLYFDCDLICIDDIEELFAIDISSNLIGAIRGLAEIGCHLNEKDSYWNSLLELDNPFDYFNSGVMIINTKSFREFISFDDLLRTAEKHNWPCYDQDVLNIICQGNCYYLPNKWNVIIHPYTNNLSGKLLETYNEACEKPCIIHYASGYKPWSNKFYLPYSYDFWKYAMRTPFANIIVNHMNSNHTVYDKEDIPKDINQISMRKLITTILFKFKRRIFG